MDLATALNQARPTIGATCYTGRMLAAVDDKTRADILDALANRELSNAHLSRAFALIGYKINDGAVRRHRAGECRCES